MKLQGKRLKVILLCTGNPPQGGNGKTTTIPKILYPPPKIYRLDKKNKIDMQKNRNLDSDLPLHALQKRMATVA